MSLNSFQLSFYEAEEINKILPSPYKLEAEANISLDIIKNINNINKTSKIINKSHSLSTKSKSKSHAKLSTNFNNKKNPDKTKVGQSLTSLNNNINNKNDNSKNKNLITNNNESERKICENFYAYIENCEYCNIFYTQKYLDEPCLIDIKNKIKGRKYHYLLDIVMDLRNLCLYYSDKKFNNNINYNANQLLKYVESVYKSFYTGANKEYKDTLRMALKLSKENNKIFTEKDLIIMAEQIKKLSPKQLIGLVKLIRTIQNINTNEKYYEVDLNDLDINTLNKVNYYLKNINK